MGNACCSSAIDEQRSMKCDNGSIASTSVASSCVDSPIRGQSLTTDQHEPIDSAAFKTWIDPMKKSAVLVDRQTGLVVVSISVVSATMYSVTSPDGRLVTNIWIKRKRKNVFEMDKLSYMASGSVELLTVTSLCGILICEIKNFSTVTWSPIHRGQKNDDNIIFIVLLFNAINQLIDN